MRGWKPAVWSKVDRLQLLCVPEQASNADVPCLFSRQTEINRSPTLRWLSAMIWCQHGCFDSDCGASDACHSPSLSPSLALTSLLLFTSDLKFKNTSILLRFHFYFIHMMCTWIRGRGTNWLYFEHCAMEDLDSFFLIPDNEVHHF